MNKETQPIDRETLLKEANKIIREHEDTLAGIEATGVTQRNGVLVFTGDYFLDEQGLPTAKSTAVFNMFKHGYERRLSCGLRCIYWRCGIDVSGMGWSGDIN